MDYQVALSRSARDDFRDIVRYISLDAPERALEFGAFLITGTRVTNRSDAEPNKRALLSAKTLLPDPMLLQ